MERIVTPEHCAAVQWELEGYILDCINVNTYFSDHHEELEGRIKELFPDLHKEWVEFNINKHGENREEWFMKFDFDGYKWLKDNLTDFVHNKYGEEGWDESDSLYYEFYSACYNLCKTTQDGFWETWDKYVISMSYLQEGYDRILAENRQELREDRLGKFLDK
ncbi:MAG: putative signaling protein [uncultured marine phage]|uniref:Putative signaling protein n=1 Tax=uncultured marine phage TaxID=707152 RepID=A0A8D9C9H7_9VIRU|nr:MAG: putative signaling protein [uncultured marine phage]